MSLSLQFGNDTLGLVETLRVERSEKPPDTRESWRVTLTVDAATFGQLELLVQASRDAQGESRDLRLLQGATVVRSLELADCRQGPVLRALRETADHPDDAHATRLVTLEFEATLQDSASAIQSHEFTVDVERAAGKPQRVVTRGKAILRAGEAPADHEAALIPALTGGYRRVNERVTRDANEPSLAYEATDEQVFAPLPGGVDDGHYVVTQSIREDGSPVKVIRGFFVGSGAYARALALRPSDDRVVSARVSTNPFSRRVDFEFREDVVDGDVVAQTESLTFTTTRRIVDHPLLDGALPAYRQEIGAPQTEVIQEGSSVGRGRHASPPVPRYPAEIIERRVQYSLPLPALPADRRWVTTWRYVSRSTGRVIENPPEA